MYESESRNPSYDVLKNNANVFGVPVDYLLELTDDPTNYDETEKLAKKYKLRDVYFRFAKYADRNNIDP